MKKSIEKSLVNDTNLFELSWSWYESYESALFIHENKTETQFKKDVKFLLKKYGEEYLSNTSCFAGAAEWIRYIFDKMPELGYKQVNPIREDFFGAYIIKGEDNEEAKEWGKMVGKTLLNKAIEKNKKIEEGMHERLKGNKIHEKINSKSKSK